MVIDFVAIKSFLLVVNCHLSSILQYAHIMNIKDVKYLRIFMNIKTGFGYYNQLFLYLYFLEQQSQSIVNTVKTH